MPGVDSANFMESLTGWKLKAFMYVIFTFYPSTYSCPRNNLTIPKREVPKITVRTHRFSATKTYTDAKVHFWDKHTKGGTPRTQLAIRAQRAEKHWWLTTPGKPSPGPPSPQSYPILQRLLLLKQCSTNRLSLVQPSLLRHHRRPSGNPLVLRHLTLQRDKRLDTKDMTATSCYDEDPPPTPLLTNCTLTCLFSDNTGEPETPLPYHYHSYFPCFPLFSLVFPCFPWSTHRSMLLQKEIGKGNGSRIHFTDTHRLGILHEPMVSESSEGCKGCGNEAVADESVVAL